LSIASQLSFFYSSTGTVSIASTANSTSTTTGALVVSGGLGVSGNIYFGGNLYQNGTVFTGSGGGASSSGTSVTISDSAPASPSAGNLWWDSSVGNLAIYYNDGDSSQWVDAVSAYVFPSTVNNLTITTSTQASSTITGALIVTGGAGIGGNLYVGGQMYMGGLTVAAGSTLTNLILSSTSSSTSTTTGALIVTGGAGIGGSVNIGGSLTIGTTLLVNGTALSPVSISDSAPTSPSSGQLWWDSSVGNLAIYYNDGDTSQWVDAVSSYVFPSTINNLTITTSTQATSTTTGALIVTGGAGIGGSMYVASTSYIAGAQIITTATIGNYAAASGGGTGTTSTFVISNITQSSNTFSGALQVWGGAGVGGNMYIGGNTVIQSTTNSTSTNTGALVVRGGVGLSGNLYISGSIVDVTAGVIIGGQTTGTTSTFLISNTTTSTSTTTGAFVVSGGAGIGGNLYVGGDIVASKLTIEYTTITTTVVTTDDIIRTSNSTVSTSTTTGALVITGGVGIGGTLYAGAIYSSGTLLSSGRATVSDSAPTSPLSGQLWWDSSVGNLAIYYNDGDSSQWVDAVNTVAGGSSSSSSSGSSSTGTIVTISDNAPSSPSTGTLWWDSSVGNLVIYYNDGDSSQWVDAVNSVAKSSSFDSITVSGNAGIGTSSPPQKLTVNGAAGNPATSGSTQNGITRLSNTTDNGVLDIGIKAGGTGAWLQSTDGGASGMANQYPLLLNPVGGNVGIGVSSTIAKLTVINTADVNKQIVFSDNATYYGSVSHNAGTGSNEYRTEASGLHRFFQGTSATADLILNASGNLGLGVTPSANEFGKNLQINQTILNDDNAGTNHLTKNAFYNSGWKYISTDFASKYTQASSVHSWYTAPSGTAGNAITFTQAMTLNASGNLLLGTTSQFPSATSRLAIGYNVADFVTTMQNSNASPFGTYIKYSGAAPNNSSNEFIYCHDGTLRFSVMSNGGISNYSGNNVNLSDRREKTNFAPAKSYLDVICAIPIQTFNYIDQNLEEDGGLTLGVVAQDVQAVAPELVMESNKGTKEEPKMRLSIYQTDLQYALMKCIQEQQALIESLTERLTALESK